MKRREILKTLSAIPVAGGMMSIEPIMASVSQKKPASDAGLLSNPPPGALALGPQIYQSIGVEPMINCRGTFTIISGSIELPEVQKAVDYASRHYVHIDELAMAVGKRLAAITGAEWGMVSSGCAAGLKHVTVACITDGDPEKLVRVPDLTGFTKTEVIVPGYSRNQYDHAIRNAGIKMITVNSMEEFRKAVSSRTAMIYLFSAPREYYEGPLSIENIAPIARENNIPILVDAAAEILTIPNDHLKRGATVVAYSGGKALRGPQGAGLLLGSKDLLFSTWQASSPHHGPGRDNKIGKEEHIGMLAAVEAWAKRNHPEEEKTWISWLEYISRKVTTINGVTAKISEPQGVDNRSARLSISWDPEVLNITGEEVADDLLNNKPRIALGGGRTNPRDRTASISISAQMMQPGDEKIVADRVYKILSQKHEKKVVVLDPPAANLVGHWDVSIDYYSGKGEHKLFLEKQEGNEIKGTHKSTFSLLDIAGQIDGKKVRLQSFYSDNAETVPFTFDGVIDGDTFSGVLHLGEYRSANFIAKRSEQRQRPFFSIRVPSYGGRKSDSW
ncbi:MAG TPA: aminotransferase class V-fold PLP-dependent enzyme [Bacteroidales bacterium]|nr:aminotransferase class V-fold PLP-dependent enzyme [Bacteroidales bacterium]HNR40892.1 aminotransferase class V-fold PLP-dependent enzyme [Bacteroidales bacterium]HPM19016.1 aminotransferase class V-fold PLP-dependent enzyme [Bacteroidales bacterium]